MRLLADGNVEQPVIDALRRAGHDVLCVGDLAPGCGDREVFRLAYAENCVLLTNDKDFAELTYRGGKTALGVVLLRFSSPDGAGKAALLMSVLPTVLERIPGHFAVLTDRGIRLRPLPPRAVNQAD